MCEKRPGIDALERAGTTQQSVPGPIGAPLVSAADFPFEIGQKRLDEILAGLTLQRRKTFSPPASVSEVCAVLFTSRSGSTWLGQLLGSSKHINIIREYMRPIRLERFASWSETDDLAECAERLMAVHAINGLFGFKGALGSLVPFVHSGAYASYKDALKIVLMSRRDIVAQAISMRKAELTGVWHSLKRKQPTLPDEAFDYSAILKAILNIAGANSRLRDFAERNNHPWIELTYEDLRADPAGQTEAVLRFLGRPLDGTREVSAQVTTMRDQSSQLWAARFRSHLKSQSEDVKQLERAGILERYDVL